MRWTLGRIARADPGVGARRAWHVRKLIVATLVGVVLGVIGARVLFVGSGLSLIPWSIVGMALGAWCSSLGETLSVGAVFGFVLAFVFMVAGYAGAAPLLTRVLPFAALGVVGAVFGMVVGLVGFYLGRLVQGDGRRPT